MEKDFSAAEIDVILADDFLTKKIVEEEDREDRRMWFIVLPQLMAQPDDDDKEAAAEALAFGGRYVTRAIKNACSNIASCRDEQNYTLNATSYSIGRLLAGARELGVEITDQQLAETKQRLFDAAMRMENLDPSCRWQDGGGQAARTTINSGFSSGLKKPKDLSHVGNKSTFENGDAKSTSDIDDNRKSDDKHPLPKLLVELAQEECALFHDASGNGYATVEVGDHREVWPVQATGFRNWLSARAYAKRKSAVPEATMNTALATINAIGLYEGKHREVFRRRAFHDGAYWMDLCDDDWRAIRIDADGWEIVDRPPVMFTRSPTMRSLPEPEPGGDIDDIWNILNIGTADRDLVLAWTLECFRPETPDPGLGLIGEQGSAKSMTQEHLRALIDPSEVPLRGSPKTVEDIYVAASNSMLLSYENLSLLEASKQDALCSISTGGGFATRTLYSNGEETVLKAKAPVILNGIADVVTAPDLLDRFILVSLPKIKQRKTPTEVREAFEVAKPKLFGALLTLFARTLRKLPKVHIDPRDLPRMADFAWLGEAMARVVGQEPGDFLKRYTEKRRANVSMTLDASPVGAAVQDYLAATPKGIDGTVSYVFRNLECFMSKDPTAPKSARSFGNALRRVAPALAQLGIRVTFGQRGEKGIPVSIIRVN